MSRSHTACCLAIWGLGRVIMILSCCGLTIEWFMNAAGTQLARKRDRSTDEVTKTTCFRCAAGSLPPNPPHPALARNSNTWTPSNIWYHWIPWYLMLDIVSWGMTHGHGLARVWARMGHSPFPGPPAPCLFLDQGLAMSHEASSITGLLLVNLGFCVFQKYFGKVEFPESFEKYVSRNAAQYRRIIIGRLLQNWFPIRGSWRPKTGLTHLTNPENNENQKLSSVLWNQYFNWLVPFRWGK